MGNYENDIAVDARRRIDRYRCRAAGFRTAATIFLTPTMIQREIHHRQNMELTRRHHQEVYDQTESHQAQNYNQQDIHHTDTYDQTEKWNMMKYNQAERHKATEIELAKKYRPTNLLFRKYF